MYASLQGEGVLAGTPSAFVRTSGCNLRCRWCDTPFTSWQPEGEEMPVAAIVAEVLALGRRHVVVTGGEPLLHDEIVELCRELRELGHHVTIETAGTVASGVAADLMSVSPKLANSGPSADVDPAWSARHERSRRRDDVVAQLLSRSPWQLKFVIDSPNDVDEAIQWIDALRGLVEIDAGRVFFMPQGVLRTEIDARLQWLGPICRRRGLQIAPRHHIDWFGHARGT